MGNNCIDQDCQFECCTIDGYCPTQSKDCHYGYTTNAGILAAIVIGSIVALAILVLLIYLCYNKFREREKQGQEEGEQGQEQEEEPKMPRIRRERKILPRLQFKQQQDNNNEQPPILDPIHLTQPQSQRQLYPQINPPSEQPDSKEEKRS